MVHVRFRGQSHDLNEDTLRLRKGFEDAEVRRAVARQLDARLAEVEALVLDRTPAGDIILRPEAVFG